MKYIIILILVLATYQTYAQKGLAVGIQAPLFSASDQNGKNISLAESLKKGPVVIIFYRGYWCPNCMRALKNLQDSLSFLSEKSATVLAISPETPEGIAKSAKISKASYSLISDQGLILLKLYDVAFEPTAEMDKVHKQYGIDVQGNNGKNGNILPRPAAYVINADGKIVYRFINFDPYSNPNSNTRITVKELLTALSN